VYNKLVYNCWKVDLNSNWKEALETNNYLFLVTGCCTDAPRLASLRFFKKSSIYSITFPQIWRINSQFESLTFFTSFWKNYQYWLWFAVFNLQSPFWAPIFLVNFGVICVIFINFGWLWYYLVYTCICSIMQKAAKHCGQVSEKMARFTALSLS